MYVYFGILSLFWFRFQALKCGRDPYSYSPSRVRVFVFPGNGTQLAVLALSLYTSIYFYIFGHMALMTDMCTNCLLPTIHHASQLLLPVCPPIYYSSQEQLTAVRGYAVQEVNEVEESTIQKLEDLKQEYEVEVEQLGSDLAVSFFFFTPKS